MRPAIRLIAVDLDGTLLNSQKRVCEEDRQALEAALARGLAEGLEADSLQLRQRVRQQVPLSSYARQLIRSHVY